MKGGMRYLNSMKMKTWQHEGTKGNTTHNDRLGAGTAAAGLTGIVSKEAKKTRILGGKLA